jgi:hypothetical protein
MQQEGKQMDFKLDKSIEEICENRKERMLAEIWKEAKDLEEAQKLKEFADKILSECCREEHLVEKVAGEILEVLQRHAVLSKKISPYILAYVWAELELRDVRL